MMMTLRVSVLVLMVWSVTPAGLGTVWCGTSSSTGRRRPLFHTPPGRSARGQRDRTHRVGPAADVELDALELPDRSPQRDETALAVDLSGDQGGRRTWVDTVAAPQP